VRPFGKLALDDQRLVLRAAAHDPSDTKLGSAIRSLLSDPDFGSLKSEEKTSSSSRSQVAPNAGNIDDILKSNPDTWQTGAGIPTSGA
jgi:hypothetical protein